MKRLSGRLLLLAAVAAGLTSASSCGDDPVKPVDPPRITRFTATPEDIMPGDSSLLAYTVTGADSVRLVPDAIRLSPATSGDHWVKPSTPTVYSLIGYNKSGKDSASVYVTMNGAVPVLDAFALSEDTILIGDSATLEWRTTRADSIVIDNGTARIADADSGGVVVNPTVSKTYRAIAYNEVATDTATAVMRVEVPYQVVASNGSYYKGTMGDGIGAPPLNLQVLDQQGQALRRPWLHFSVVDGDGTMAADSVQPNSSGIIVNDYWFDGQDGYGLIRAILRDKDTLDVKARASVIRFGSDGQGQYVKLYDNYSDIFGLNGQPASIDHPVVTDPVYYVNYENALGVVPIVLDLDEDGTIENTDPVFEVILNTVFNETTLEGIGVGSTIAAIRGAYGVPDILVTDPDDASSLKMTYSSLGVLFYLSKTPPDSATFEIHLWDPALKSGDLPAAAWDAIQRHSSRSNAAE